MLAAVVAPLVTGSILSLALASTALVVAGLVAWLLHLRVSRHTFD